MIILEPNNLLLSMYSPWKTLKILKSRAMNSILMQVFLLDIASGNLEAQYHLGEGWIWTRERVKLILGVELKWSNLLFTIGYLGHAHHFSRCMYAPTHYPTYRSTHVTPSLVHVSKILVNLIPWNARHMWRTWRTLTLFDYVNYISSTNELRFRCSVYSRVAINE